MWQLNNCKVDILATVAQTMIEHGMVAPGDNVLVGVSGGVDSVTLLWCLIKLAERFSLARIGVAHLNHGLRGQAADDDMAMVRRQAETYGTPFYGERADVTGFAEKHRLSLEDAARRLRYDFFYRTALAYGYDRIATAHNSDDNAEQVLMGLIRGSGLTGLSGIPPVREGRIIRPMINLPRSDIEAAAGRMLLAFTNDATNNDRNFLRNRVRHELIPFLRRVFNANISENLNRLADICRQEDTWLEQVVTEIFTGIRLSENADEVVLSVSSLIKQPRALQRRLIRKALAMVRGDLRRITFAQTEKIVACLDKTQQVRLDLPGGIVAAKSGDRLVFCPAPAWRKAMTGPLFAYDLFIEDTGKKSLSIPEIGARIEFNIMSRGEAGDLTGSGPDVGFFDLERLTFPLIVRNVLPGDRFVPLGMKGHQKIKDFFIDHKVPRQRRLVCPVVVSGDRIIWLAGFRTADPVRVTPATRRMLRAELVRFDA